ncbi:MAG: 4Fe-4S dicluster domain-containing protein [Candidatus Lambdaproteobacteria bacterium]|nr:4Fe-4S dicluster domain-containing protein [Candidatus Lambdaproteobacteria bacterium]
MGNDIQRRDFFKVLAATGAATAAVAGCADPPEKLIPYLVPPTNIEFVPGHPVEYATTCMECPAACGMVVKTREGRAIKAEGNPDHPGNAGALCVRGQASLQTLYNPARLASALVREGTTWKAVPWTQAETTLAERIRGLSDRRQLVYLTGNGAGTRGRFLDAWLAALGGAPKLVFEPLGQQNIKAANDQSFRRPEIPQYRIEQATFLLNFGSDFLETWLNPVRQARAFAAMHAIDDAKRSKGRFVHVGPHVSLTGANADQWVAIRPGSERILALALAREVLQRRGKSVSPPEAARLREYLAPYTLESAQDATGVAKDRIAQLAREFAGARSSLALAGGTLAASEAGTATQVAVNLLNHVAGNLGKTVHFGEAQQIDHGAPFSEVLALVKRMQAGAVQLLIVDGANPLHALPATAGFADALAKVPTVVSLSPAWDETTSKAHLVLPGLTFLESWGDAFPQKGVNALVQPVMAPVYPLKSVEDTLLAVARAAGATQFEKTATYYDYLRAAWAGVQKEVGNREAFDVFWRKALQAGGVFQQVSASGAVRLDLRVLAEPAPRGKLAGTGLVLLPTASLRHHDGRGARNPWLQEIPDPISQVVWDSWADIHPTTAKRLGIAHGQAIRVKSPYGEVETAAYLHYGVHEDAIAIPLGQGRTDSGRDADQRGVNVMTLLPAVHDPASGQFAFVTTRVSVEPLPHQAFLVQTDGSPRQLGRGIIQQMSLEQVAKGEAPAAGHGGEVAAAAAGAAGQSAAGTVHARAASFYPPRERTPGYHDPYRWGMSVDGDRCTGCSACVAACYAENNIPVVGKERVGLGREMSWLRIERFIEGRGEEYQTLLQPMFCQQCSNAGCEPVCPVYATYHNPEGLNAQVYNRCVGTRYCSNNCAYKVRRFNWFNYEFKSPLHLQLNPDVTVRSKGVMEKCTFCVQRIQHARLKADGEGRPIKDGEVQPACVQTCPTRALTFGNLADPASEVSRKSMRGEEARQKRVRQYEVLEELANLPAVTYQRRVRVTTEQEA